MDPRDIFISIHMYTHVQFKQIHNYIQNKNKMLYPETYATYTKNHCNGVLFLKMAYHND